jgi:hypothetical protein
MRQNSQHEPALQRQQIMKFVNSLFSSRRYRDSQMQLHLTARGLSSGVRQNRCHDLTAQHPDEHPDLEGDVHQQPGAGALKGG